MNRHIRMTPSHRIHAVYAATTTTTKHEAVLCQGSHFSSLPRHCRYAVPPWAMGWLKIKAGNV